MLSRFGREPFSGSLKFQRIPYTGSSVSEKTSSRPFANKDKKSFGFENVRNIHLRLREMVVRG
jgi:hypothetical protein